MKKFTLIFFLLCKTLFAESAVELFPSVIYSPDASVQADVFNVDGKNRLACQVSQGASAWTVTANQGTTPWTSNVTQFGSNNVVTGTGASGAGIPRVTIANDSSLTNITGTISLPTGASTSANQTNGSQKSQVVDGSGNVWGPSSTISAVNYFPVTLAASGTPGAAAPPRTIAVGGQDGSGNLETLATDPNGNAKVIGNVADAAADSGNPVKIGGVYNTVLPTYSNGQRANIQVDANGRVLTNSIGTTTLVNPDLERTDVTGTFTTTGNTTALDSSPYSSIDATIDVTAASGTTPTLDISLQVSDNGSTNWFTTFQLERVTATGIFRLPSLAMPAQHYRWLYTIGGTTPSFTFTIKIALKASKGTVRNAFNDFSGINLTTVGNVSASHQMEQTSSVDALIVRTGGTQSATIAMQFSMDNTNWISSTQTATVAATGNALITNSFFSTNAPPVLARYFRLIVTASASATGTVNILWFGHE